MAGNTSGAVSGQAGAGNPARGVTPRPVRVRPVRVILAYTVLALLLTYPLCLNLARAVPNDIGDPLLNTWILAWDAHALLTQPLRMFDANVFFPLPDTLAYSEHLLSTAGLVLPLQGITGQPLAPYNLSLIFTFVLAGLGAYLLVLRWTGHRGAAFLAGLAFAFAPYRLAAISHLQLLSLQWLPFCLLALDTLLLRPGDLSVQSASRPGREAIFGAGIWKAWLLFVLFAWLQIMASWYLAVFAALVLGVYLLAWLVFYAWFKRDERHVPFQQPALAVVLVRLVTAGLVLAALTLPVVLPYLAVLPDLQVSRTLDLTASLAARPSDFLASAPYARFWGPLTVFLRERPGFTEENTLFPGLTICLLALAGLVLARRPSGRSSTGTSRCMGGWRTVALLVVLAVSLLLTQSRPYLALVNLLPVLKAVRVPSRWIIPATFALALLAGQGAALLGDRIERRLGVGRSARRWCPACAVCLLGLLMIVEALPAPLPLAFVGDTGQLPPVYSELKRLNETDLPPRWGVVEIPMYVAPAPEYPETRRMLASRLGWWGLVNGYSGFTPARQERLGQQLAEFPSPEALSALRGLGEQGVRYLIVHPDERPMDREEWQAAGRWQAERQTSLLPLGQVGIDELYVINPYGDDLILDPGVAVDAFWQANAPQPLSYRFGTGVNLLAYHIRPETPGCDTAANMCTLSGSVRLTLYWQAETTLEKDLTVFVHCLDGEGKLIGQADSPPVSGFYPTTAWLPGEIVQDSRLAPAGSRYLVGLYDPATGQRLPAFAPDGSALPNSAVTLPAQ